VTAMVAREYLFPLKLMKIDTLVLGCTHYPILRAVIQQEVEAGVVLVDSGEAVAEEVETVLNESDLRNPSAHKANVQFFVSDIPYRFAEIGERFLGQKLGKVRKAVVF